MGETEKTETAEKAEKTYEQGVADGRATEHEQCCRRRYREGHSEGFSDGMDQGKRLYSRSGEHDAVARERARCLRLLEIAKAKIAPAKHSAVLRALFILGREIENGDRWQSKTYENGIDDERARCLALVELVPMSRKAKQILRLAVKSGRAVEK